MRGLVLYVGCYTAESGGKGEGISAVAVDPESGVAVRLGVVAPCASPSYLAWHPRLPVLYAVHEQADGGIGAWWVESATSLRPLGAWPTGGAEPCHIAVDPHGRHLVVTNYGSGSVALHPLDETGAVGERTDLLAHEGSGPDPDRQAGPHTHMSRFAGDDGSLLVVDLGCDAVFRHRVDEHTGRLTTTGDPVRTSPGAGPRHIAIDGSGRWYLSCELDGSVTFIDRPTVDPVPASVPASDHAGARAPAEITLSADGRHLYVSNRGPDTVSTFDLAGDRPRMVAEVPTGGHWPRHFAISGDLMFVANERSHSLTTFRIDPYTGEPHPIGAPLETPSPTCVLPHGLAAW
ncbi:MAG TPA: lactonase family protein [Thermopolyspora sp.]